MADLAHIWGGDLSLGPTGDLAVVTAVEEGRQRVLRRLLTNAQEYLWQPVYGAGLPGYVGQAPTAAEVVAVVRGQMALDAAVAQNPPPTVTVGTVVNGMSVDIAYTDSGTGSPVSLSFDITPP